MRWLGMTAAIATLIAVVMNSIWFARRGLGLGGFVSMAWPAALATFGLVAFALVLGFVSVRALNRSAEGDGEENEGSGDAGRGEPGDPTDGRTAGGSAPGSAPEPRPGERN
ncbi:MAG TPA: hypothetical protein VIK98_09420 [Limnochordales bacterium]